MRIVKVNWDTDNIPAEELNLPYIVEIPNNINDADIADYLSDTYGYCISSIIL